MENESKLRKAKCAVWLNRYFNWEIPFEYFEYILKCQCCTKKFVEKFVLENPLPQAYEQVFLEEYIKKDEQLVASYISKFGCCKNVGHHILIALSGSFFLYDALQQAGCIDANAQLTFFKGIKSWDDKIKFVKEYRSSFYAGTVDYLLQMQNSDLLALCIPPLSQLSLNSAQEDIVLRSKNHELFKILVRYRSLSEHTLENLILENNTDCLQIYFVYHDLPNYMQVKMASQGNKEILTSYVNKYPLCDKSLFELIKADNKDILKLHYLKHGISERALAYLANLAHFKSFIGVDEKK